MIVVIHSAMENSAQADSGTVSKEKATHVFFPKSRRCEVTAYEILSQV